MVRGHCATRDVFFGVLQPRIGQSPFHRSIAAALAIAAALSAPNGASADEGGVSFWVPGFYGSLAATPQEPGWSIAAVYYHANVSASGNAAISRAITIGQFNPRININVNATLDGGVGYTYFDEKTGHEFSAVAGLTGNFENQSTGYTNANGQSCGAQPRSGVSWS